jgi:HEAT repeat protein
MKRIAFALAVGLVLALAAPAPRADTFVEAVTILRNYQDHDEPQVIATIQRLAAAQERRAIGPLSELLDLGPGRVRLTAAARQALLDLGAMEAFQQKLQSGQTQERQETAAVLSRMGPPALELLLPLLQDPSPELRNTAVTSLGLLARSTGDRRALDGLVRALADSSPYVQESAVLAIGNLGSPEAIDALVHLLRRGELVPQIGEALQRIASAEPAAETHVVRGLGPLLQDSDLSRVESSIVILRNLQGPQARAALIQTLRHPSPRIRFAAIRSLAAHAQDPAVRSAVEALQHGETDSLVLSSAASLLAGELSVD